MALIEPTGREEKKQKARKKGEGGNE